MSQHEFDQFLSLLNRLLRLSSSEREAIANELCDHLEERLTELLSQGVPRYKAIETALEEFGDAAGLAVLPDAVLLPCLELDITDNGLRIDLSQTAFDLEDGMMVVRDRPGLGVDLDEGRWRTYLLLTR